MKSNANHVSPAKKPNDCELKKLDIGRYLTNNPEGRAKLEEALADNTFYQIDVIGYNNQGVGNKGVEFIADLLKNHSTLTEINFLYNQITDVGV